MASVVERVHVWVLLCQLVVAKDEIVGGVHELVVLEAVVTQDEESTLSICQVVVGIERCLIWNLILGHINCELQLSYESLFIPEPDD